MITQHGDSEGSQIVDSTIHTVQNICEELRPALLDNLGLVDALEWQIKNFRRRTGLEISFSVSPRRLPLSGEDATLVFRLFKEIMNNIFLHAQATRVKIALKKDGNLVKLDIRDNGRGITEAQINHPRSFGIMGMRERAEMLGGTLVLESRPGAGTKFTIRLPARQPAGHRVEGEGVTS